MAPNLIYRIEVQINAGSSAAWAVRIDGIPEMSGTGNFTTTNSGSIKFGGNSAYTCVYFFDDIAADNATWVGPVTRTGPGTPTGTVQLTGPSGVAINPSGPATLDATGSASFSVSAPAGTQTLTGTYTPTGGFQGSVGTLNLTWSSGTGPAVYPWQAFGGTGIGAAADVSGVATTWRSIPGTAIGGAAFSNWILGGGGSGPQIFTPVSLGGVGVGTACDYIFYQPTNITGNYLLYTASAGHYFQGGFRSPPGAPIPFNLGPSWLDYYTDEANLILHIRVKLSDNRTVVIGSIPLVPQS